MSEQSVADARQGMLDGRVNDVDPPPVAGCEDRIIAGARAAIAVRIYRPRPAADGELGVMIYFHGRGFVVGDLDTHDNLCRSLCLLGDIVVIAVDYRLAPEHRYPAAVEDAPVVEDELVAGFVADLEPT